MEGYYGREAHQSFASDAWFRTGDRFDEDADGFLAVGLQGPAPMAVRRRRRRADAPDRQARHAGPPGAVPVTDQPRALCRTPRAELAESRPSARGKAERAELTVPKVPTRWLRTNEVPLLASGKVDRQALRDLLETEGA
jgi:non-ribosomal peptide synthetase component E (peptide arylation enzyme)